jgi:hypothetical protein
MGLAAKIVLIVAGAAVLLACLFYLWLVIAHTPPRGPDDGTRHRLLKEGTLAGPFRFRILRVEKEGVTPHVQVETGAPEATGGLFWTRLARVYGTPLPVDARAGAAGQLELVFDGPLEGCGSTLALKTDDGYAPLQPWVVRNGKLEVAATW